MSMNLSIGTYISLGNKDAFEIVNDIPYDAILLSDFAIPLDVEYNKYLTIAAQKGDHIVLEADGQNLYDHYYVDGSEESELIKIVVDGNVYRVLSRVFGISTAIDSTEGKKEFNLSGENQKRPQCAAFFGFVAGLGDTNISAFSPWCQY